jgi:hypothetical protein
MDRKLEHQHEFSPLPFGVLVVRARSNRMRALRPLVDEIHDALARPAWDGPVSGLSHAA